MLETERRLLDASLVHVAPRARRFEPAVPLRPADATTALGSEPDDAA